MNPSYIDCVEGHTAQRSIASIVLNFGSNDDLFALLPQLAAQEGIDHTIIVVDNASSEDCRVDLKCRLLEVRPDCIRLAGEQSSHMGKDRWLTQSRPRVIFIQNEENRGYSAGNNVGIRFAQQIGADAVLIANPDMQIDDVFYIERLCTTLFTDSRNLIAASRILGLDGKEQNPIRESSFAEELLWPLQVLHLRKSNSKATFVESTDKNTVEKVSGSCLLIRMNFLTRIGLFDENTFLYCEEPILAAQVKRLDGQIAFTNKTYAIHAHDTRKKANSSARMLLFIKSRIYFIDQYSNYSSIQKLSLRISYEILRLLHSAKLKFTNPNRQ